jgi:DNA replication protein DnaD
VNPHIEDVAPGYLCQVVGREFTSREHASIVRWVRVYGPDWTEQAIEEARSRGKNMCLAYIGGMLRKWGQQGCVCR